MIEEKDTEVLKQLSGNGLETEKIDGEKKSVLKSKP